MRQISREMTMAKETNTILIIGGGPAGLTAAYQLQKEHYDGRIIILEASDHLGGIAATIEHNGNYMDLGGHRFFTKSEEVLDIWFDLFQKQTQPAKDELEHGENFGDYSTILEDDSGSPEKRDDVMLTRRRVSRIYYKGKFFDYPIKLSAKLFINMGFVDTLRAGFGYMKTWFKKLPEDSLENFYINRFGKPLYQMFFESYTEKLWGIHPSKLDASWGAQRVKGLSVGAVLKNALFKPKNKETSLIERFYYPKFGPGQMWTLMAERLLTNGAEICYNAEVRRITKAGDTWRVMTKDGDEYTADKVISSMPIRDLIGAFGDAVPADVKAAADLHYRDFQTVGILAKKLNLANKTKMKTVNGIIPDCWIYIQDAGVTVGRVQVFNNWSPYLVKDENTCWIGMEFFCNEGDELWNMTDEEFTALAVRDIEKLGIVSKENILDTHRIRVKKAYPVYDDAYQTFDKVKGWLNDCDGIYCVGRNGQHRYNNLDHSMLTGYYAARCITRGEDKTQLWAVNTEKEYHESKS